MFRYYLHLAWLRCRKYPITATLVVLVMAIGIASFMITLVIFLAFSGEAVPGISSHLYVATMDARVVSTGKSNSYVVPDSLLRLIDAKALVTKQDESPAVAVAKTLIRVTGPDVKASGYVYGLLAFGQVTKPLGVSIKEGRSWTVQEQQTHAPVTMISAQLAEKLFGTTHALGKSVTTNGHDFRVIGVTNNWKPRFQFIRIHGLTGRSMQIFLPVGAALDAGLGPIISGECRSGAYVMTGSVNVKKCRWLEVWMTLHTTSEYNTYQRFLTNYAQQQHATGRFVYPPQARLYSARNWVDLKQIISSSISLNLAISTSFLLLCLFNAICFLTTRFMRSRIDTVVRRALGASRRQLLLQHIVESGLFGLFSGIVALPITLLGMTIVRMQPAAYVDAAKFSVGIFVSLLAIAVTIGIIVGMLPAWRIASMPPALQIKQE